MKVTAKQLIKAGCCSSGVDPYFKGINRKQWDVKKLLALAIKQGNYQDCRYGLSYMMTKIQRVEWAVYCAEQVLHLFEDKHPDDKRPRLAIKAAKKYLKNPTDKNAYAAYAAAYAGAAYAAAYAAYAAADAAADAASDVKKQMQKTILDYGYKLLKEN